MGQVVANASMSLDGYIAKDDNTIGRLFDWLQNGEVEIVTVDPGITFHLTPVSAEMWLELKVLRCRSSVRPACSPCP
jgi:hypothetical protein